MQNANFLSTLRGLRRILPTLSWLLLGVVYVVSGWAGGSFLVGLMGGSVIAYGISFAIQATRATIVFFPQMNPDRPSFGWTGEIAALFFGALSIYEMYSLTSSAGLSMAVFVSVAVLMVAGIVIEVMMLREVKDATEKELIGSPETLDKLSKHYVERARLRAMLEAIEEESASGYQHFKGVNLLTGSTPAPATTGPDVAELQTEIMELRALVTDLEQQRAALAGFVPGLNGHSSPLGTPPQGVKAP